MEIKKFDDGTVMTEKHVGLILALGAVGGLALFTINEKLDTWRTKRWMRKTGWPQEVIDRM